MEQLVCKHFQTGFCKFAEHCSKQHVKEICQTNKCGSKTCIQRHPNICKYFTTHNACKFGDTCAYQHKISKENSNIKELVDKLFVLENTVQVMSQKIEVLENKLQNDNKESDSSSKLYKCDHCDYNANTSTVLKRHTISKHKGMELSKENKESDHTDIAVHPPQSFENQPEKVNMTNLSIPPFKHPGPDQDKEKENKMSCDQCGFKCDSELVLKHHIAKKFMKPAVIPPPYSDIDPKEKNSECAYCNLKFVGNHAYGKHLIEDHKFFYFCGHCQTQLPHSNNIYNIHFSTFHPGVQYEKPMCYTVLLKPLASITEIL